MRTRLVVSLAFGTLATLGLACSSSTTNTPAKVDPYPDVNTFCAKVAAAECQSAGVWAACSVSDGTNADCVSFRSTECLSGAIVVPVDTAASLANRTYTSSNVQACLDKINGTFSNSSGAVSVSYSDLYGAGGLVSVCEQVFVGSAAHGSPCASNYDCTASGDICGLVPGKTVGKCATPTPKVQGDSCADEGDQCGAGTYCAPSMTGPTCVASLANGQACTSTAQCATTDHCGASGTCTARGAPGDRCATNDDCDPTNAPFCDVFRPGGAVCSKGLGFVSGGPDCEGFLLGKNLVDGGAPMDSGSSNDSGSAADSGSSGDASGD